MKALFLLGDAYYDALPIFLDNVRDLGVEVQAIYNSDNGLSKSELLEQVKDVDIIVVATVKIDKEVIDAAPNLKYIIKFGAGYDNIDATYAKQKQIQFTNAPGQNAGSVADLAFGHMLSASRNIPQKDQQIKAGTWEMSMGYDIQGKCIGIIGFGQIGQAIAKRANGFDMEIVSFANYQDAQAAQKYNVSFVELDQLLATSDIVVLCTKLNDGNRGIINKEKLRLMKSTAILVNVSRDGLINEEDLIEALKTNQIRGGAFDVFATEPPSNELPHLPNVVATPHIGGATFDAVERIATITTLNISNFIRNEELTYVVS